MAAISVIKKSVSKQSGNQTRHLAGGLVAGRPESLGTPLFVEAASGGTVINLAPSIIEPVRQVGMSSTDLVEELRLLADRESGAPPADSSVVGVPPMPADDYKVSRVEDLLFGESSESIDESSRDGFFGGAAASRKTASKNSGHLTLDDIRRGEAERAAAQTQKTARIWRSHSGYGSYRHS